LAIDNHKFNFWEKNTCQRGYSNLWPSATQAGALPTQPHRLPCLDIIAAKKYLDIIEV
jgi:hypothetical protein